MNLSNKLVDLLKDKFSLGSEKEAAELVPKLNKQNLSAIRKSERHLTEEQALWIAEQCQLDPKLVLVELAEECSKSEIARHVWHELAKKMKAAASVLALTGLLLVSSVSGGIYAQRRKYPIMSRLCLISITYENVRYSYSTKRGNT